MLIRYNINNTRAYPFNTIYNTGTKALNNIMRYLENSKC